MHAPTRLSFTPCPKNPTSRQLTLAVNRAFAAWMALQIRAIHPDGTFDDAGRWYPSDAERCDCCAAIRGPSRAYPYSLIKHCRSVEHVARRFRIDATLLRKRITLGRPKAPRVHADHFKVVAVVEGRYLSIFDGTTEYRIGETLRQPCRPGHGGGYYCYPSLDDLLYTDLRGHVPPSSALRDAPKAILRVRPGGRKLKYDGGKVAFSELTPVEVLPIRLGVRDDCE